MMTTSNEHNNAPAVPQGDTVEIIGMKGGKEHFLGTMAMPPRMKAREIAREQFGHFVDDDGSDAELCFGALDQLIDYMQKTGATPAPAPAVPTDSDPTSKEQYRRMFVAACEALGAISDALGCDPEDGGAEPILGAVEELQISLGLSNGILGCLSAAPAAPQGEPVKFLANGTRFKMSFFDDGDSSDDTFVKCFNNFRGELDGRWVALVPAEDDCHRKLIAATPAPAPAQEVGLTEEAIDHLVDELSDWFADIAHQTLEAHVREVLEKNAIIAALRAKGGKHA